MQLCTGTPGKSSRLEVYSISRQDKVGYDSV
jgi:hypothetical protein